ncbi:MAG: glycosyltransferase [Puniceicoccales bacterium]|jgi:glycosyltransferase involved in cell wall biosynthesis|nr:glycosyltransferase [Puniceicoccales bacterium]
MNAATSKMNMATPKVSVVVPIYNTEKYLRQCLDSIVGQTLRDLEIILVDDGSTDGSAAIVDEYAKKDRRIVAIHQRNGGMGKAYNSGIARAGGEYIGLVESDDWIEPDMYELLYAAAKKYDADLAKSSFFVHIPGKNGTWCDVPLGLVEPGKVRFDLTMDAPKGVFCIEDVPLLAAHHTSLWTYLYRRDFVRQIFFVESPQASYQDAPFVFEVLCRARSIVVVPRPLLHLRDEGFAQKNSSNVVDRRVMAIVDRFEEALAVLKKFKKYEVLREAYWLHAANACECFYGKIAWKFKKEMFFKMHALFRKLKEDGSFTWKYFSKNRRKCAKNWCRGRWLRSLFPTWKSIRAFLFCVHFPSREGFIFQLLGFALAGGRYVNRPAFLAWRKDSRH